MADPPRRPPEPAQSAANELVQVSGSFQQAASDTMVFHMIPDLLVGIQLRRVRQQIEEPQLAVRRCRVGANWPRLVNRMAVHNQENRPGGVVHQLLQKLDVAQAVELALHHHEAQFASERWSEYYAALLGIVVGLHEEQALPLLVDSADSTMSHLNTTIAAYGAAALPFVLDRLKELSTLTVKMPGYSGPPIQSQMALADILAQMILLDQNHKLDPPLTANNYEEILQGLHPLLLSPSSYVQFYAAITLALGVDSRDANTIRKIFAQQLASPSPGERIITLQKLSEISDPAFIPLAKVKDLAENDPFFGQPLPGLNPLFRGPAVRRLAKRVLQKFPDN